MNPKPKKVQLSIIKPITSPSASARRHSPYATEVDVANEIGSNYIPRGRVVSVVVHAHLVQEINNRL